MGFGHGKKRPLPGGETSESKRGFSGRGFSIGDAAVVNRGFSGHISAEEVSAQFSPPTCGFVDEMPVWRDDSYSEVDSEACVISSILEGRSSSADEPSARTSVSEAFCSQSTTDSVPKLGNKFVEFERHRNWVRSVGNRRSAGCVGKHGTFTESTNGLLILHHGSMEESGNSHARRMRAQWSQLNGSAEGRQQGGHLAKSRLGVPIGNFKDESFGEADMIHQNDSNLQVQGKKPSHRPTFAIFLGKILSDYSASLSGDEKSRFSISVDRTRVADCREGPHRNGPFAEDVPNSFDGMQETEPDSIIDSPSGELQNERRFISYVNSSGRLFLKEEAREPTIDHEFEERFSALFLS